MWVKLMRWGFRREFNTAINNARSDKLEGGMWREAFHERRCVIPMTLFYEWSPGVGGRKQANEFRDPDDDFLWAGDLWEGIRGPVCPTRWSPPPPHAASFGHMALTLPTAKILLDGKAEFLKITHTACAN
jgi:putative SOS response-associated peptidase YedK